MVKSLSRQDEKMEQTRLKAGARKIISSWLVEIMDNRTAGGFSSPLSRIRRTSFVCWSLFLVADLVQRLRVFVYKALYSEDLLLSKMMRSY